jgi:hypothetical protein
MREAPRFPCILHDARFLYDHRFLRHVVVGADACRVDALDPVHDFHPVHHLPEDGVAVLLRPFAPVVQEIVVDRVDEELRGC